MGGCRLFKVAHKQREQHTGCTEELFTRFFSPLNSTMYIKFCQRYEGDSKHEGRAKLSSDPKLCVALEGGKGEGEGEGRSRLSVLFFRGWWWWCFNILLIPLAGKQTAATGNIRLYKLMSAVLAVLCVLLLLITIALALKRECLQPWRLRLSH